MKCYNAAKKIVETLQGAGFTAYFAGGWVRDHLLGKEADDIDIATDAVPEQVMELFPKTIPVGIHFSIIIVVQDEVHCEVATFREESGYHDGRRPKTVRHTTAEEDAKRRDFTINGMFFDPVTETVYDFVDGKKDLARKVIRAIGDPHLRFQEDRLRMIRACRYSARFSFPIEEETAIAILAHASELFPAVAIERVYDEFKKMTRDPHLFEALLLLHKYTLLGVIFQGFPLLSYEKLEEKLRTPLPFPEHTYPMVYLFELLEEISLEKKIEICTHFRVSNKELEFAKELHKWEHSTHMTEVELVELYSFEQSKECEQIASIHQKNTSFEEFHKSKRAKLFAHVERSKANTPLVSASDLIERGYAPGKELGALLKRAKTLAIELDLSTKEEVLERLL